MENRCREQVENKCYLRSFGGFAAFALRNINSTVFKITRINQNQVNSIYALVVRCVVLYFVWFLFVRYLFSNCLLPIIEGVLC